MEKLPNRYLCFGLPEGVFETSDGDEALRWFRDNCRRTRVWVEIVRSESYTWMDSSEGSSIEFIESVNLN